MVLGGGLACFQPWSHFSSRSSVFHHPIANIKEEIPQSKNAENAENADTKTWKMRKMRIIGFNVMDFR